MLADLRTTEVLGTTSNRRRDIQGLRALAVLLVVSFHAGLPVPGGFIGVDVFFVISGYVITAMLVREMAATSRLDFSRFYRRRVRRLLPALALMTTFTVLVAALIQSPIGAQQLTAKTGIGATYFVANLVIYRTTSDYFAADATLNPLLHTWSLSVEEQFYFVFPLVLLIGWTVIARRLGSRTRGGVATLAAVGMGSFVICIGLARGWIELPFLQDSLGFAFYSSTSRAWEFAAGGALALVGHRWSAISRGGVRLMGALGAVLVAVGAFAISESHPYPGFSTLLPVVGTCMLLAAGAAATIGPSRWLATSPMVWLGDLSYSWYLWHWPLLVFTRLLWPGVTWLLPLVAAASLLPAWLSFRFVESPLRRDRPEARGQFRRVAVVVLTVPAIASLVLFTGANNFWGSENARNVAEQVEPMHVADALGCTTPVPLGDRPPSACRWNVDAAGTPLYLVGDSNASQFSEAMIGTAKQLKSPLLIGAMSSCEFIEARQFINGTENRSCRTWVTESTRWLTEQPPGVVVVSDIADRAIAGDGLMLVSSDGQVRATTPIEKAAVWQWSLSGLVTQLTTAGHSVVLVAPIPHFTGTGDPADPAWRIESCIRPVLSQTPESCGRSLSRDEIARQLRTAYAVKAGAAVGPRASTLDLRDDICDADACSTNDGRVWLYRDGDHISVLMSERLAGAFTKSVVAARGRSSDGPAGTGVASEASSARSGGAAP